MWDDPTKVKAGADVKAAELPESIVVTFKNVLERCTQKNFKKSCTLDEVYPTLPNDTMSSFHFLCSGSAGLG